MALRVQVLSGLSSEEVATLDCDPAWDVSDLKWELERRKNLPEAEQRLLLGTRVLCDKERLGDLATAALTLSLMRLDPQWVGLLQDLRNGRRDCSRHSCRCAMKSGKSERSEVFDEAWSTSIQSFIQRSPPGHLPDVLAACRLLVSPAKLPKDLVWRACASHNEKNLLLVRQPAAEGAEAATSGEKELLVVHDGGRAGSRAQQQVPYKDGIKDYLFAIDHEKQECTRYWLPPKSDDLMAQMENIDEELAKPFKEALHLELKRYLDESYVAEGGTTTGAAALTLYSKKGKEVGGDIELGIIISARRARPRGLWSGSWSSQWRTLFVPGQAEAAKLLGIIEFTSHYAEEGNVHFRRRVECHASVPETKEPTKFAELVVKQIERDEENFHFATQDSCDTLCDGAVKALRRALPVSKEHFDWRPLRHALVRDMKAYGNGGS